MFSVIRSCWDTALSLASIYKKAVNLFNSYEPSRYTWMRCLPNYPLLESEADLAVIIIKGHNIFWSEPSASAPSCLCRPSNLLHVPSQFRDRAGVSLLNVGSLSRYRELSQQYQSGDFLALQRLGVRTLDHELFTALLSRVELKTRPSSWHEDLAKVLAEGFSLPSFSHLSLVPLVDPRPSWISIQDQPHTVYLHNKDFTGLIPTGLGIILIDPSASRDPHRAELFKRLGAIFLRPEAVRKQILDLHQSHYKSHLAHSCTVTDLVSHAKFLFRNRQGYGREDLSAQLYFADHVTRECCLQLYRGGRLYCPKNDPLTGFSPSHALSVCSDVKFIHSLYLSKDTCDDPDRTEWLNWLHNQAGISYFPRLFDVGEGSVTKASNVLKQWIEKSPVERLVGDIANHWDSFGIFLSQNRKARDAIRIRLRGIVLPLPEVDSWALEMHESPFLKIYIPTEKISDYQKLDVFGVITVPGIQVYLYVLERLRREKSLVPVTRIHAMYRKLQECSNSEEGLIR